MFSFSSRRFPHLRGRLPVVVAASPGASQGCGAEHVSYQEGNGVKGEAA